MPTTSSGHFLFMPEMKLKEELFSVRVPFCPELIVSLLHFATRYLRRENYKTWRQT